MNTFVLCDSVDSVPKKKFSECIHASDIMGKSGLGLVVFKGSLASEVSGGHHQPCLIILQQQLKKVDYLAKQRLYPKPVSSLSSQYSQQWRNFEAGSKWGTFVCVWRGRTSTKLALPSDLLTGFLVHYSCNPFC